MAKAATAKPQAEVPAAAPDIQTELTLDELAAAVLSRSLRPRVVDVRRLAEGVLERAPGAKKAKKKKSAESAAKPAKKGGAKKRKLAKIPASKG